MHRPRPSRSPLRLALLLAALVFAGACDEREFPGYVLVELGPGPDLEDRARAALRLAKPGTIIELPAGRFEFHDELAINTSHIVIRGQGMGETILSFENQRSGAQGILATADEFVIQDLAVEDAKGDGIRVEGANGVTFERVRVEWTGGPLTSNGSYGLYPVGCRNVLVKNSIVRGASDAGIYVGQSYSIVVRQNIVEFNVAGIEIENSQDADVYLNVATKNTGGILVFDLPGNPVKGMRSRVFSNLIFDNNTANFAPAGNVVANVPQGTGVLVMANRDVEVRSNLIRGNQSVGVAVVSHEVLNLPVRSLRNYGSYDPYPERIHIHDNQITEGGFDPQGDLGRIAWILFYYLGGMPAILYDGILENDIEDNNALAPGAKFPLITEKTDPATGELRADRRLCIQNNFGASFGDMNELVLPVSTDATPHDCSYPSLSEVTLADPTEPPVVEDDYTPEEVAALCSAPGVGVNWAASVVNCPKLSDYRLFPEGDPTGTPSEGGVPYELTTPLFSDYSTKYRVLFVPPGTQGVYSPDRVFDLPVGTIIAKTFTFRTDLSQPALGERWVETRLLIHRPNGWRGVPYVWADDRSEAHFTPLGTAREVSFLKDGMLRTIDYRIPNVTQCTQCHGVSNAVALGDVPIGPKARLLNKSYPYVGGAENQLAHWQRVGVLSATPEQLAAAPRLPVWDDPTDGTLEQRARGYLESNCAHCHNPQGRARFSSLFLETSRSLTTPSGGLERTTGLCKSPVAAGVGSGDLDFDIVPGHPEQSILPFRMNSVDLAARMPEISKAIVHAEGVKLVEDWIASLPPEECLN
jgi:parallel beta-helix repeat protein